jgi:hypothetical protein
MALLASGDKKASKSALEVALKLNLSGDDAQKARETLANMVVN